MNNNPLFAGDVVTHVNGTALESLTREQVIQLLSTGKNEATLSVVPLSPLRAKRIMVSKLQETTISDAHIPSRSTAAEIAVD